MSHEDTSELPVKSFAFWLPALGGLLMLVNAARALADPVGFSRYLGLPLVTPADAPSLRWSIAMTAAVLLGTAGAAASAAGAGEVVVFDLASAMIVLRLTGEAPCRSHQPEPRQSHRPGLQPRRGGCDS
jgi:hypothetical protein